MKNMWLLALLAMLSGAATAQETNLYVVDVGPSRMPPQKILRYDQDGQNPVVFTNQHLSNPQDIVFIEDQGIALVSNLLGNNITKYDAETGAYLGVFADGIGQPTRMEFGEDGLLYVLQWAGNGRVLRYDLNGNLVDQFTDVGVSQSIGLDWDSEGNLYVASFNGGSVRKFDTNGHDKGLVINSNLTGPTNIWFNDEGDLMVLDWSASRLRKFTGNGAFVQDLVLGIGQPEGIEFLDNGDFLIAVGSDSDVREYNSSANFVKELVTSGSGGLIKPNALRFRTLPGFVMTPGLNGTWWGGPARSGEGAQLEVADGGSGTLVLVATFYSYNPSGQQIFMVIVGTVEGDSAIVDVYITQGGKWGDNFDPNDVEESVWGSGTFTAIDCETLQMSLVPNDEYQGQGYTALAYNLVRLTKPALTCP